jgi:hypothetical protein
VRKLLIRDRHLAQLPEWARAHGYDINPCQRQLTGSSSVHKWHNNRVDLEWTRMKQPSLSISMIEESILGNEEPKCW